MLENIKFDFNSLLGGQKTFVGISITPGIGIEIAQIDYKEKLVTNYVQEPIEYNFIKREIEDYSAFKNSLETAFSRLNIDPSRCDACLVIPNVLFDIKDIVPTLTDEEKQMVLLGDVENSYQFSGKSTEIAFCETGHTNQEDGTKSYMYAAVLADQLANIKRVIQDELGANIVAIENSHSALMKGISYIGLADEEIAGNKSWDILLVNNNNFAIFSFLGEKLNKYIEVPLAIKSLTYEEAYQAVITAASQNLENFYAEKLVIVSFADDIGSEILRSNLKFSGNVETLDFNRYSKKSLINTSSDVLSEDRKLITLYSISAAIFRENELKIKLDFLHGENTIPTSIPIPIAGKQYDVPIDLIKKVIIGIGVFILAICTVITKSAESLNAKLSAETSNNQAETVRLKSETKKLTDTSGLATIDQVIEEVVQSNKEVLDTFSSIANDIPKNVWLTYFESTTGSNSFIEGMGMSIKDVYLYYRNLKLSNPESTIELKELRAVTDILSKTYDPESQEKKVYYFTIGNISDSRKIASENGENNQNESDNEKEKKTSAFDWLTKYAKEGNQGNADNAANNPAEKPPEKNEIQLESIDVGK